MSRTDSCTLHRLAYLDKVYLTRHGQLVSFRSRFICSKSPQVIFLTDSRLQVDFKSILVQVKSVSPNKVTARSVRYPYCIGACVNVTSIDSTTDDVSYQLLTPAMSARYYASKGPSQTGTSLHITEVRDGLATFTASVLV